MAAVTEIREKIEIPNGVEITIDEKTVHVKGEKGALSKMLSNPRIEITVKNNIVEIRALADALAPSGEPANSTSIAPPAA